MTWQPPTPQQIRAHALGLRAASQEALGATVGRLQVVGLVTAILGVLVAVGITPVVWLFTPAESQLAALAPVGVGLGMVAFGVYSWALYRPLPRHLLQTGVPTPAVILTARAVGPMVQTRGFGVDGTLMRTAYLLELHPQGGPPYQLEIRTFGGPMVRALNRPPLTVYVDRANRMLACPDWSTLPQGA